jgi:signal transduction histidine kinase
LKAKTDECDKFEELKGVLVKELQRTQDVAHKLRNDLTAIGGYAEIMVLRPEPERAARELRKLLDHTKKSVLMLQDCIANLQEVNRKYSR